MVCTVELSEGRMAVMKWNPKVRLLRRVMSALSEEYFCAQ
jgi:hypothetical protein